MRLAAAEVSFRYPGSRDDVLTDVTLKFEHGSATAIVGPSGSGKSTLAAVLGGLLVPTRGAVHCADARGVAVGPRDVSAWVFQTLSLVPERTALDNVCIGAYLDGCTVHEAETRARQALGDLGLSNRVSTRARLLSGGESQRVAIARALVSKRQVIFADEPTGQLDATTSALVLNALFSAHDRTIVLVTHDEQAAARCDHHVTLWDGRARVRERLKRG